MSNKKVNKKEEKVNFKMQIKSLVDTMENLRKQMVNEHENTDNVNYSEEVQPVVVRKTPKFPSRERHLAIRRKRVPDSPSSQSSESIDLSPDSSESTSCCLCDNE